MARVENNNRTQTPVTISKTFRQLDEESHPTNINRDHRKEQNKIPDKGNTRNPQQG